MSVTFNTDMDDVPCLQWKCDEPYFALLHFAAVSLGLLSKLGEGKPGFDAESLLKAQEQMNGGSSGLASASSQQE